MRNHTPRVEASSRRSRYTAAKLPPNAARDASMARPAAAARPSRERSATARRIRNSSSPVVRPPSCGQCTIGGADARASRCGARGSGFGAPPRGRSACKARGVQWDDLRVFLAVAQAGSHEGAQQTEGGADSQIRHGDRSARAGYGIDGWGLPSVLSALGILFSIAFVFLLLPLVLRQAALSPADRLRA